MIVLSSKRTGSDWYQLLGRVRGTVTLSIGPRVGLMTFLAGILTYLHHQHGWLAHSLTHLPFTFIGLALSVFLGFRNSTSYDRFWEGRRLWGQLVNSSRSLGRQLLTQIDEPSELDGSLRQSLTYYLIAYAHSLRCHLRGDANDELAALLSPADFAALSRWSHPPLLIAQRLGEMLRQARQAGWLDPLHLGLLERHLDELIDVQGGCERIKGTPIPFGYLVLLHQLVAIYCLALPFGIVDQLDLYTPFVVMIVSYAFLGLDAIGDLLEDPFQDEPSDLPLSAICRTIEINLRQQLGETDLPEGLKPDENCVLM